jgi:hypothetical protein
MSSETKDEIWKIFCQVYGIKLETPKSLCQNQLLQKLDEYVDSKLPKEKKCLKK